MPSYDPPTTPNSHHTLLYSVGPCVVAATLLKFSIIGLYIKFQLQIEQKNACHLVVTDPRCSSSRAGECNPRK